MLDKCLIASLHICKTMFYFYLKVSPDGVHILDKHPKYPNIVVGCGFSGNTF